MQNETTSYYADGAFNTQNQQLHFRTYWCSFNNQKHFGLHEAIFGGELYTVGSTYVTVQTCH
jgi:hypothetical protein